MLNHMKKSINVHVQLIRWQLHAKYFLQLAQRYKLQTTHKFQEANLIRIELLISFSLVVAAATRMVFKKSALAQRKIVCLSCHGHD